MQHRLAELIENIQMPDGDWSNVIARSDSENDSIALYLAEYGDLAVTVTFKGDEWLVMATVEKVAAVTDQTEFNANLLRLGITIPLVSVGIVTLQGEEHYVVYGQLYADCKLEAIQATVAACARAALEIAEIISKPQ